jgi:hypothetical protein
MPGRTWRRARWSRGQIFEMGKAIDLGERIFGTLLHGN